MFASALVVAVGAAASARAAVSLYEYPVPRPTPGYTYKGWQAYDPSQPLTEPALPNPMPAQDFTVTLDYGGQPQASKPQLGSFLGVSIEMSLAEAIIGPNSSWLRPQFLNLMSELKERGGPPVLRVGGNTQEKAFLVDSLPNGASTGKLVVGPSSYTNTPTLLYTKGILEAMRAASDLLGINWFMGIPMNQTNPPRLEIVEIGEPILGDYLLTWQLGNEPDLYPGHGYRPNDGTYTEDVYMNEYQAIIDGMQNNPKITKPNKLGGPGVCECGTGWSNTDLVNNFHYIDRFNANLNAIIVEHYPVDNCPIEEAERPTPQAYLELSMMHSAAQTFAGRYVNLVPAATAAGKPVVLLETNTASCNGFLGMSDAFGAALWAVDLALQLAAGGWTHMMLHLGGQAAFYNPFVPPPHNSSAPFMWSVGPPMYAILLVNEALGSSGQAQVADLGLNGNNTYTPGYVIYENNVPARLVLINFLTKGGDYVARVTVNGASEVKVRHLKADGVTSKTNITYAGQTWGGYFESDGLLRGQQDTETVPCSGGVCPIAVSGPSAVVVFLTGDNMYEASDDGHPSETFATSHTTRMHNTAAVPGETLAASNGMNAQARIALKGSSTSAQQKVNAAARAGPSAALLLLAAALAFAL